MSTLLPIRLPPGFYSRGTDYQSKGRWLGGDRVRFYGGAAQSIGGWERRTDELGTALAALLSNPATQVARAMHTWRANDGTPQLVVGHNEGLVAVGPTGVIVDITPAGFATAPSGPTVNDGYGGGYYGLGTYGTARVTDPGDAKVFNWCMRNWGEDLMSGARGFGSVLYSYSIGDPAAVAVPGAPADFNCFNVTPQRIVMLGGSLLEPRLLTWSDSEDRTLWTPDLTNQAGNYTLPGAGDILEIATVLDNELIVTETDAYVARYIGPPFVYGFDKVGDGCGAVCGAAVVTTQNFAVWPSTRGFFVFDGTVRNLPCDVIDTISETLDSPQKGTFVGWHNPQWREVWWQYEKDDGSFAYVVWGYDENYWLTGTLERSAGIDNDIFPYPLMIDPDGFLYNHDLAGVVPGDTASETYLESGAIELGNGDQIMHVARMFPDFESSGSVNVTMYVSDRPGGPERTYGPYNVAFPATVDRPIMTRARGRTMRLRIEGDAGPFTVGVPRLELIPGGAR